MKYLLLLGLFALAGCRVSQSYPFLGATVGGTAGSLGGPLGGGAGAAAGWSVGKGAQLYSENKELVETVEAISKGDIGDIASGIVKREIAANVDRFDEALDFLYLCLLGVVAWNLIPLLYTHYVHRKAKENGKTIDT
jgi:hypothetical protein